MLGVTEERALPGTDRRLSVVGYPVAGDERPDPLVPGLLRRAFERGVRVYDASRAEDPAAAERAIALALRPAEHPELFLATRAPAVGRRSDDAFAIAETARAAARRFGGRPVDLLLVDPGEPGAPAYAQCLETLRALRAERTVVAWGVDAAEDSDAPRRALAAVRDGASAVFAPYNLLERETVELRMRALPLGSAGLLVRDPHAGGALNGRLLRAGLASEAGRGAPLRWSALKARLSPVTRLGFLTEGRRRTLGQAALAFCLADPRVVSVLPEFDSPQAVDEYTGLERVPPLDESELARLRREIPLGAVRAESVALPPRAGDPSS